MAYVHAGRWRFCGFGLTRALRWQTFHRTHYRPDNAHLYIVGDVDVAQAEELIKKYFGHLESGPGLGDEVRAVCVCVLFVRWGACMM